MVRVKVGDLVMAMKADASLSGRSAWHVFSSAELPASTGVKVLLWAKAIRPVMEAYNEAHRKLFSRLSDADGDSSEMVIRPDTTQFREYTDHMSRVHDMEVSLPVEHIELDDIGNTKLSPRVLELCSFVFADLSFPEVDIPDFGLDEEA